MFANFLPTDVARLSEATSIALAQQVTRQAIATPLTEDSIETAYVHQGTGGTPILLVHGFDSSVFEFRRLVPLLAEHQDTWAVDLLGFGFTDRPISASFDPTAIKTHLHSFWKTLIDQPMILVGASMGGAAAIDFALTYPEAVAQLVLIDSAGFAAGSAASKFMMPPLGYLATEFLRQPSVRRQVSLKAYADRRFVTADAELCAALHLQMSGWSRSIIAFTKSGGYNFLREKISQISPPTLILWGESDQILGIQDAERFRDAIPTSQLHWVQHCGHVPHLEQPIITAESIRSRR